MQTLNKTDLNFVLSRCPKDLRKFMLDNPGKLFLAGGFIRSTISGEKVSDIDLFGQSKEFLLGVAKDLTLQRKGRYFETKNAFTVLSPPRQPVQFITRWVFQDPQSVVASFDFTVCQAVIWAEAVEGRDVPKFRSAVSEDFYPDLAARRLVYTFPQREEEAGGSMLRAIKFIKRGYNIQAPSLAGVITRLAIKVRDTKMTDKEEEFAMIITGLLREVDPMLVIDGVDFLDEHEVLQEAVKGGEDKPND